MVRELDRVRSGSGSSEEISPQIQQQLDFPATAPTANPVFFRTYSRFTATGRETWQEVCTRTLKGLVKLGKLTDAEADIIDRMQRQVKAMPSGRWLWVGGSEWLEQPQNFSGAYNCTSTNVCDWAAFALMMDLAMMGCGTGAILEPDLIGKLPVVKNKLNIAITSEIGGVPIANRQELSTVEITDNNATIRVGDSRQGWVNSYKILLELSSDDRFSGDVNVSIDLSNVRPAGEQLKGFGGMANPVRLPELYGRCAGILNKAIGRQLTSVECCLLIDEAAVTIVAGNIRRCLPAGALVHAESGLVPIEKIRIGDRVLTSKGFYPVTNFFDQGEQSLCRIKTQDSYFECTADHKVAVLTDIYGNYEMVKAKDLQPNDRLVFVPQAIPGTPTELPAYNDLSSTKNQSVKSIVRGSSIATIESSTKLQIPTLTSEVAYCLGYLTVNSILTQDGSKIVFFIQAETPRIIQRLVIFSLLFGIKTHHIKIPLQCLYGAGGFELEFNSPEFTAYLSQFRSGQIPDSVLHGTVDIRQAYLAGLGDAESRYSEGMLAHDRKNSDFLKQVQILYASLGIKVRNCSHSETSTQLIPVDYLDVEAIDSFLFKHSLRYVHDKAHNPKLFNVSIPQSLDFFLTKDYKDGVEILDVKIVPCQGKHQQDKAFLTPINVESIEMDVRTAHTYDIEVASIHEFVCEGILVSNSAGMRQFNASDTLGATAKDNLWQQDEHGNWRIDPERDALRMSNHTRVFHHKPTLEECVAAVQKQYYSGEGAIQWAGEAVARSNADLLTTPALKANFLKVYAEGKAKEWLENYHPNLDAKEIEHRLSRFGLNPCGEIIGTNFHCVSGETLLITRDGLSKIKDIIDREIEIWNGNNWSKVTPFQTNTNQKLYRVQFSDGSYLDATEYHRFFVKDRFGKEYKEVLTKDLMDTSRYQLHTEPFQIQYEDGSDVDPSYAYTLGVAVGDGTLDRKNRAKIRLYEGKSDLVVAGHKSPERNYDYLPAFTDVTELEFSGEFLKALKTNPEALDIIASWNRQAILHFIAGLADTDGSNTQSNGIRIYISDRDRAYRCQLLLAKCGIRCSLNLMSHKGAVTNYGVRSQDLYYLQITTCTEIPCQRLDVSKSTDPKCKGKWQVIRGVEELPGLHDTFCFNEPEFHKGVFGLTLTGNCNLSEIHLNQLDPNNHQEQKDAFTASALSVAALLNHKFQEPRYQYSRELDPIVGVSFTGLFDFFVHAFGSEWLQWWTEGRPATEAGIAYKQKEHEYLNTWREVVEQTVWEYCDRHGIKRPNRCTTVQPSGTKSLLTGASPGWHAPKAQRFIRRITFRKDDPVALACIDYGYSVIPSQSDKDENGNLLDDAYDPRCTEWLIEIPVAVSWADLPGADSIEIGQFSALAQMDFYMGVQQHYVRHNTSATIELRENEVDALGKRIFEAIRDDEGYISAALLARFDDHQTFPRLPFEPIDKATYDEMMAGVLSRRQTAEFHTALSRYDLGNKSEESGPAGCDSDKCLLPDVKPNS